MGDELPHFPIVHWNEWDADAAFLPGDELPAESRDRLWAVLVFVFYGDKLALADIEERGMCIPSGRIEPDETIVAAALREASEEVGAVLDRERLWLIGSYRLRLRSGEDRYCPVFIGDALGFVDVRATSESRGRFLAAVEDVADLYYTWDDLMASVFAYADEKRRERFIGTPLSKLMGED